MRTDVKIYTFVKENAKILSVLNAENYEYTLVNNYEELKKSVDTINYLYSHVLIIDLEYVFTQKSILNKNIKKDLMRSWLAVVGYSEKEISLGSKSKLYRLDFKALLDKNNLKNHSIIVEHMINYANLHMETLQNNFIKALLHFNDLDKASRDAKYLVDYLTYYYNLSKQDAADILLVVSSLIVAFQTDTVIKISEIIYTIFKSQEVNNLYKSYIAPKTFTQQLVSIILYSCAFKNSQKYLSKINMTHVDTALLKNVQTFFHSKNIILTSYGEIDLFWEQIHLKLFDKYKNDDFGVLDHYLEIVYQVLIRALIRVGYVHAYMEFDEEKGATVHVQMMNSNHNSLEECLINAIEINQNTMELLFNKQENEIQMKLNLSHTEDKPNKTITKHTLDKRKLERMHYKEEDKISAKDFLREFEVDRYMLDELNENEIEIKDTLFAQEELDDDTLQAVSTMLDKYVSVLYETIEFDDIATSLDSLSRLFKRLPVSMIDESKREQLRYYIQGLIDDLGTWKKYIFIEPNTPDIHYLDASLLENCATIEHYIFAAPQEEEEIEEDDDDLEFF